MHVKWECERWELSVFLHVASRFANLTNVKTWNIASVVGNSIRLIKMCAFPTKLIQFCWNLYLQRNAHAMCLLEYFSVRLHRSTNFLIVIAFFLVSVCVCLQRTGVLIDVIFSIHRIQQVSQMREERKKRLKLHHVLSFECRRVYFYFSCFFPSLFRLPTQSQQIANWSLRFGHTLISALS